MGRFTRKHTRISRPLIAVLGVTMVVGAGVYINNVRKHRANNGIPLQAVNAPAADGKAGAAAPGDTRVAAAGAPTAPAGPHAAPSTRPAEVKPAPAAAAPRPPAPPAPFREDPPPVARQASASLSGQPLVDAKTKMDGGNLLDARGILNTALAGGHLSAADAASARQMLGNISQTVFFSKEQFKDETYQTLYKVKGGDRLARIADRHAVTWELLCRINGLSDPRKLRVGQTIKIPTGPFHCVITKSEFRMDVYLGSPGEAGSLFVTSFRVGLGKDNSTPTGTWMVASGGKAHPATYYSPRGEGVIAADDPKNPLGGYWIGLTGVSGEAVEKASYGIHGTIEPDSIGKQASMGCIRLGADDISLLYDLLVDGKSKVVVQ